MTNIDPKQHFLEHAEQRVRGKVMGPDLVYRTAREERELNLLFSRLLDNKTGEKAIAYLRSITLDAVTPPDTTNESLQRVEGARFLAAIIINRVQRGRK